MKGCNTEERHIIKSLVNAYRKAFPSAFRRYRRLPKKKRDEVQKFINLVEWRLDEMHKSISRVEVK